MAKRGIDMDNCGYSGECSKPKKSKSSDECLGNSEWAYLPSIVLHQIFDFLNPKDRTNASIVCRHWRQIIFHPKWWTSMNFKIEHNDVNKANFYISTFGTIVSEATVALSSLSPSCLQQFVALLRVLKENNHLRSLVLEPTHCRFEIPQRYIAESESSSMHEITNELTMILPRLSKFSIGCVEDLTYNMEYMLEKLRAPKVTMLGLASVKDDPGQYEQSYFDVEIISHFTNLQVLSIDYDHLSDVFLNKLEGASHLSRLVVHLHAIPKDHPSTSNKAWKHFKKIHPGCLLRLSVIHAYNEIDELHLTVLRDEMPLSHLKVFFCENVNMDLLQLLPTFYSNTLQSIIWVDSLSDNDNTWKCSSILLEPDPFVIMSWQCSHFEELIICGYKYCAYNLIAIGRLRGPKMKNLEIPMVDILFSDSVSVSALSDISSNLQRPWKPLKQSELHSVILDPLAGDSDEFLLPYVLADLR